jgi:formamidopyrimidine-DNA glycosylase
MPELPEVTLTANALHSLCTKKELVSVIVHKELKSSINTFADIEAFLPCVVEGVSNRAKYIIFDLASNVEGESCVIMSHMMLTGSWTLIKTKHTCVELHLRSNSSESELLLLYYNDTRKFGRLDFCTKLEQEAHLTKLKPTALEITSIDFVNGMRKKNRTIIYNCIMDQNAVLSGVGNYIANESLYRSGIAPRCIIKNLKDEHLEKLYEEIQAICEESIAAGGMCISDYVGINGEKGTYQNKLLIYKNKEAEKMKISGRSVYWDPVVQTLI